MNKELLLELAALLDVVPEEKFNMKTWGVADVAVGHTARCVSTACALGWATAIPECKLELVAPPHDRYGFIRRVDNHGLTELEAAMKTFGLSYTDAEDLFMAGLRMTPKQKAAHIRAFVRDAS